jgi:hypothetical protein
LVCFIPQFSKQENNLVPTFSDLKLISMKLWEIMQDAISSFVHRTFDKSARRSIALFEPASNGYFFAVKYHL